MSKARLNIAALAKLLKKNPHLKLKQTGGPPFPSGKEEKAQGVSNSYSRAAGGRRPDLGNRYFRSRWEANYARYLNLLIAQKQILAWDYECQTFYFESIKRGVRSYTPDFKVTLSDMSHEWHEVKGWMDDKSAVKLKRMARFYPAEKVTVIDDAWFEQAYKTGLDRCIPNWERGA